MNDSLALSRNRTQNQWVQEDGWYVWREATSRPFALIRLDATRSLFRGISALTTVHEWHDRVLHVRSVGCYGTVTLKDGFLTTRMRFDIWGPANFIPFLKSKILSEVA